MSFTQASFEDRAKQLIEAIRLNKDAYRNNIVILANVGLSAVSSSIASYLYAQFGEF